MDPGHTIDFAETGNNTSDRLSSRFSLGDTSLSLSPLSMACGTMKTRKRRASPYSEVRTETSTKARCRQALCRDLDPAGMRGRVILIRSSAKPHAAPTAAVRPEDGVNMNRAFPGKPRGTAFLPNLTFCQNRIFPQVRVVIDIHAGGKEAVFPLCTSFHPLSNP